MTIPSGVRVEWTENPLASIITLDEIGRLRLKLGIAEDAIYSCLACASLTKRDADMKWLSDDNLEWTRQEGEPKNHVRSRIERDAVEAEKWLTDVHCGDCTCVPATCLKCVAENYLGFSTTDGLGKHQGYHVQSAFNQDRTTLDQAIEWLEQSPLSATWAGWEAHAPRWRAERDDAVQWLKRYQIRVFRQRHEGVIDRD